MSKLALIQSTLGVRPDEIWGPKSQAALNAEILKTKDSNLILATLQEILEVNSDGIWGHTSQTALNAIIGEAALFICDASSFADPADVIAFNKCKSQGKSDKQCFAVGDNGIGQFGKITAQDHTPMIAVHHDVMVSRWGSEHGAAHRPVEVMANGHTFTATVEDRISAPGRIDLNPACAKIAGLQPPFVVPCTWRWL